MNLGNIFAVLLLSLVVLRPTLTIGADDPLEFIKKICTKGTTCPIYKLEDPTIYSSICIKFMSPSAGEIASDLGRAAVKSVELEISSTEYLKKFKPPPGTNAYMLKKIQMAKNCVSTTYINHHITVSIIKSMVPKPPGLCKLGFKGVVLRARQDIESDTDTVEKCLVAFDPPESPLKTDFVSRLNDILARTIVSQCILYSYSQMFD